MAAFISVAVQPRDPEDPLTRGNTYLIKYDDTTPFWRGPWEDLNFDDFEAIESVMQDHAYKLSKTPYYQYEIKLIVLQELPPYSKWMKGREHPYYTETCLNGAPRPLDLPRIVKWSEVD